MSVRYWLRARKRVVRPGGALGPRGAAMQMSQQGEDAPTDSELLYVGFNQDQGCFACGTTDGFCVYNCDPFKLTFRRGACACLLAQPAGQLSVGVTLGRHFVHADGLGAIGIVEMLFRCNILALVGGRSNSKYPPNKVMIWDDHQIREIGELAFRNDVKAVRLRRDRIIVVLEHRIYVYNFSDLKLLHQIETVSNPKGLCALCPASQHIVLACPGVHRGHVRIDLYDIKKTNFIAAHETTLSAMALNADGTRLATSSEKGTLIRVFDTQNSPQTSQLLQELRRGADRAEIYSLAFNKSSQYVCVSSDRGTLHIFKLQEGAGAGMTDASSQALGLADAPGGGGGAAAAPGLDDRLNTSSKLSFMKAVLPKYFSSEWSFAQFSLRTCRTLCAFGEVTERSRAQSLVYFVVVNAEGEFYKCSFKEDRGGACKNERFDTFLRPDEMGAEGM